MKAVERSIVAGLLRWLGGALLASLLLYWVFRQTDAEALREAVERSSWSALLLVPVFNLFHNVFRVLRWGRLLRPTRTAVGFAAMFESVILGSGLNIMVPGRVGELARPAILSARVAIPLEVTLGSVLADRLMDIIAVLMLFGVGALATGSPADLSDGGGGMLRAMLAVLVVIATPLLLLVLVGRFRDRLTGWLGRRTTASAWLARKVLGVSKGVDAIRSPRLLLPIVLDSLIAWLLVAGGVWVGLRGCGIEIPAMGTLVLLPLLVVGFALPTPGGAGGYHAAMAFGLVGLFGVDRSAAAAAAVLIHLATVVPILLLGVILALTGETSFRSLVAVIRNSRDTEDETV